VVLALAGHGSAATRLRSSEPVSIDIEVMAELTRVVPVEPAPARALVPPSAKPHSHSHSYPVSAAHDVRPHDPSQPHAPLALAPPTAPKFALALPVASTKEPARLALDPRAASSGRASLSALAESGAGTDQGEVRNEAAVDAPARLVSGGAPPYPRAASEAAIEADVALEIIVDASGHVRSARALQHVGYGLEEAALRALRGYRFRPAVFSGRPSAVRMKWTMQFRLQ
jgi:protein TonB